MNPYQKRINGCANLTELLDTLREIEEELSEPGDEAEDSSVQLRVAELVDIAGLPTWGEEPDDTEGIWSYDETRQLAGEGSWAEMQIELRENLSAMVELGDVRPSDTGAGGWDVDITIGSLTDGLTLIPDHKGRPNSWGGVEHWVGDKLLAALDLPWSWVNRDSYNGFLDTLATMASAHIVESGCKPATDADQLDSNINALLERPWATVIDAMDNSIRRQIHEMHRGTSNNRKFLIDYCTEHELTYGRPFRVGG
jgi:hypothetical protein